MNDKRGNRNDYLGSTIFIVLFFLIICAFSKNSDKPIGNANQYGIASELHSNITILNDVQQVFCQKSLIPFIDKMNIKLFNESLKMVTDNRMINQRIILLQKAKLLIKPIIALHRFYYQYQYIDTEDFPILS